jgi:hypothetical protein
LVSLNQEDDDLQIPNVITASGRAQVCALISAHQMRLDAMKTVENVRQTLGAEEKLYKSLKRRLDRLQSSIAPLHCLPFELIREIAFLCVEAGDSPWDLARVCRSWRSACLGTPKLWGRLRIILCRKWPLFSRYHDGKENCATTNQLHRALVRSGVAPLHLEFLSLRASGKCSHKRRTKYSKTIDQLMGILSYPEHMSRLKSLSIDCDRRWFLSPVSERFICGPFPALEHISFIRTGAIMRFTMNIANWAPRLDSAELWGPPIVKYGTPKWIEQLRKLKFVGLRHAGYSSDFHTVLALCSSLTSLSLTSVIWGSGHNIELFSLVSLEVRHSVLFGRTFVTPLLETLVIEKTEWKGSRIKGDPRIAHLRHFHWSGFLKDWMLGDVSAHAIDSLSIDMWNGGGMQLWGAWRDSRPLEGTPFPQKLFVKYSGASVPKFNVLASGRFLRVLPSVEEVKIIGIPLGKDFLKALAKEIGPIDRKASVFHDGVPRRKGKQLPMCPSAEVLELDMTHVSERVRGGMRNLVRAVLEARRLRSLRCLWEEGGEWEEFCETSM